MDKEIQTEKGVDRGRDLYAIVRIWSMEEALGVGQVEIEMRPSTVGKRMDLVTTFLPFP